MASGGASRVAIVGESAGGALGLALPSLATRDADGADALPPLRVHDGGEEMLLDDSRRYVARAVAAGVDARGHVGEGVQHVFQGLGIGELDAAAESLDASGRFLAGRLAG